MYDVNSGSGSGNLNSTSNVQPHFNCIYPYLHTFSGDGQHLISSLSISLDAFQPWLRQARTKPLICDSRWPDQIRAYFYHAGEKKEKKIEGIHVRGLSLVWVATMVSGMYAVCNPCTAGLLDWS